MKKSKWILVLVAIIVIFTSVGCSDGPRENVVIENVVRVLYHEYNRYTFFTQPGGINSEIFKKTVDFGQYNNEDEKIHILPDVEAGRKNWVRYGFYISGSGSWTLIDAEIHIHSEKDIEGGGWNHGKFGSGATSVID